MRLLPPLAFLLSFSSPFTLSLADSTQTTADEASAVTSLTESNFDGFIKEHPLSLVEFFAPWCGHCKALKPNYEKAANELKGVVALGAVDCTVEKDLCSQFDVQGFPTLKVFRNDGTSPAEYGGGRTDTEIVAYMRKQNEPPYQVLTSTEAVTELIEKDGVAIVGFFNTEDSEGAKVFIETAKALRKDYNFAIVSDVAHFKYGEAKADTVMVVKDNAYDTQPEKKEGEEAATTNAAVVEPEVVVHSGDLTVDALTSFISTEAFPLVGDIGPENFQKYIDRDLPLVWMFIDLQAEKTGHYINEMTVAAKQFKGQLSIVKLDGVKWAEHARHFGIPAGHLPGIVTEDREEGKNYVYDVEKEVNSANLIEFLNGFVKGELEPTMKSEPVPEQNEGPVTVVVGKTFQQIVMDDEKDVFVEFYAPWCGHCKALAPKYEELGKEFTNNNKVVIAKVDATENDTPAKIQGFPTLILYPAGDKKNPISYEGERSVAAMAEWIKKHGKTFETETQATETTETETPADETTKHDEL